MYQPGSFSNTGHDYEYLNLSPCHNVCFFVVYWADNANLFALCTLEIDL